MSGGIPTRIDPTTGEIVVFRPEEALLKDAKHDAVIELSKRLGDWDAVDREVDHKLDDQEDFVAWWQGSVRKGRPKRIADTAILSVEQAEQQTQIADYQVCRWAKKLQDRMAYRAEIVGAAYAKAMQAADNHRAKGTGENEWYTPAEYIEAAREVMGGIDLDPASSDIAQKTVKASEYFTASRSGLDVPWHGRVWLNPPFSQPAIQHFAEKTVLEATEGRIEQAVILTHNYTDTAWFHALESVAARLCFTRGRIAFLDPRGEKCAPTQGQAFFYIGENENAFEKTFSRFGFVR